MLAIGSAVPIIITVVVVVQPNGVVDVMVNRFTPAVTETGLVMTCTPAVTTLLKPTNADKAPVGEINDVMSTLVPTLTVRFNGGTTGASTPVTLMVEVALQPNGVVDGRLNRFTPALILTGEVRI